MANYYLGIDIGDGETAVAVLTEESVAPQMVHLGYKDASILSAVGVDEQKQIVIGENVVLLPKIEGQTVRFKSRFLSDTGARADLLQFAQGLAQALQTHSGLMQAENQLLMTVGCPTGEGWSPETRKHYASIIQQALPINDAPVGESRAAFLYTKYGGDGQVPQHMLDGNVLVIDMGSSTTDLAYIVKGQDQTMNVFGASRLGGGLIDQMLLEQCVERHPLKDELRNLFKRVPSLRHRCEVTARKIKEAYFTAEMNGTADSFKQSKSEILFYKNTRADFTRLVLSLNTVDPNAEVTANATEAPKAADNMNALLDAPLPLYEEETQSEQETNTRPSFRASLNTLLSDAVHKTQENPPALIILTGGASKMPFFQEAVKTHFPNAVMSCCEHPEFSIASGLAFACRVDNRMEQFRQSIHHFTDSHAFEILLEKSLPSLIHNLCDTLAPLFIDQLFMPALSRFGKKAAAKWTDAGLADSVFRVQQRSSKYC